MKSLERNLTTDSFVYVIAEKELLAIVSMIGSLTAESAQALRSCHQELSTLEIRGVIFNCQQVPETERSALEELTRLCEFIRSRGLVLRFCCLNREVASAIKGQGISLPGETQDSLAHAIQNIVNSGQLHSEQAA